jgi:hypothetical protein
MPKKVLQRYDVTSALQKPRRVGVTEFVQSRVGYFGSRCEFLEPAQKMIDSPAFRIRKDPFCIAGKSFQKCHQRCGDGNDTFFTVFGEKSSLALATHFNSGAFQVYLTPSQIVELPFPKTRENQGRKNGLFEFIAGGEQTVEFLLPVGVRFAVGLLFLIFQVLEASAGICHRKPPLID